MVMKVQVQVFLTQPSPGVSSGPMAPEHEFSLEVEDPRDGIELLKFQGVDPADQLLYVGPAAHPLQDDMDLEALASTPAMGRLTVLRKPDVLAWQSVCTKALLGNRAAIQPAFVLPGDSEHQLCQACASLCFPPGLCVPAVAGDTVKRFTCGSVALCEMGLGTYVFADRLLTIASAQGEEEANTADQAVAAVPVLALLDQLQEAAFQQQAAGFSPQSAEAQHMARRLQSGFETVRAYEDPGLQAKARGIIPVAVLKDRAMAAGGDPGRRPDEFQDLLFIELLAWFKREFFRWVNSPPCDHCGKGTSAVGGAAPTPEEASGWAGRVEVYQCGDCKQHTRFPRYNHPGKLLDTRRGRCGEWANCFTLCCRALGLEARYVLDWTDHVWTEVWSRAEQRWLHADSCENRADHPMMYERGWNKKLSYVLGFAKDHAVDCTRRYTWALPDVLSRRTDLPELVLQSQLRGLDRHSRGVSGVVEGGERARELDLRARREQLELRENCVLGDKKAAEMKPGEGQGRISGDEAWKRARGEDGGRGGRQAAAAEEEEAGGGGGSCAVPGVGSGGSVAYLKGGLQLQSYLRARPPPAAPAPSVLLVSLTSVGDDDVVPGLPGSSRYCAEAISINGLAVAVGSRGHNVVVVDPSTGRLEDSRAFNTAVEGGAGEQQLAAFLSGVPEGRVVLAVVIGSGHQAGGQTLLLAPGVDPKPPGPKEAWLMAGVKGGKQEGEGWWWMCETRPSGRGPARAVLPIPLLRGLDDTAGGEEDPSGAAAVEWSNWVGAWPLWQEEEEEGLGGGSAEDAAKALLASSSSSRGGGGHRGAALVRGVSCKPGGGGVFVLGEGALPLRAQDGWTTRLVPRPPPPPSLMQDEFRELVAAFALQGLSPNEAASAALLWVGAKPSSDGCGIGRVRWSERVGRRHPDTRQFDDTELACPATAMAQTGQELRCARLREVRVWASGSAVNGLQCVYELGEVTVEGQAHVGRDGGPSVSSLVLQGDDVIVRAEVWAGNLVDRLVLHTRAGRVQSWGGGGGERYQLVAGPGEHVVGFAGGVGGHLHQLAAVLLQPPPTTSPPTPAPPCPPLAWGLYSASPVDRAARVLVLAEGREAALGVLQATRKYVDNARRQPGNPKFHRLRCQAGFFRDKIGGAVGSGALLRALGFDFDPEGADGPGWQLPLARASEAFLSEALAALDRCLGLVDKLTAPAPQQQQPVVAT